MSKIRGTVQTWFKKEVQRVVQGIKDRLQPPYLFGFSSKGPPSIPLRAALGNARKQMFAGVFLLLKFPKYL